jgi:hypothetical protein
MMNSLVARISDQGQFSMKNNGRRSLAEGTSAAKTNENGCS